MEKCNCCAEIESTVFYPNCGTEKVPANISVNKVYDFENPYLGHYVKLILELKDAGVWPTVALSMNSSGSQYGIRIAQINSSTIRIRTGNMSVFDGVENVISPANNVNEAPCRVYVEKGGRYPA